ncbi:MAG: prenyltransferase/squalene oxidase repeat-containing protein [Pirellulales bacterium]
MSQEKTDLSTDAPAGSEPRSPAAKRSWTRWILPVVALAVSIAIGFVLWGKLHTEVWSYYTDDEGLKVDVEEKKERLVLWEDPHQTLFQDESKPDESKPDEPGTVEPGTDEPDPDEPETVDPVNQSSKRVEAAFSADGTTMILTRWSQDFEKTEVVETGADLYLSTWDGRTWSRPLPMVDLNTVSNERGATFSRDGRYLYFSSDREGGAGGYDIYVARQNAGKWTGVERIGDSINSPRNETGPAPSTDDTKLYFSSDRDGNNEVHDIYVADRIVTKADNEEADTEEAEAAAEADPKESDSATELPPVPVFAKAKSVRNLNSDADDIEAALTGRGDHVFLASDRDRDNQSGFNLYLSRVVNGRVLSPEKVDVYIEDGNATDPAVRMEGFDLLFSSDADLAAGPQQADAQVADASAGQGYRLYRSTTREVIGYTDLTRWELFKELINKTLWWILLAIAALIALIYLLEKWRDITDLYHKCLAGSAMIHLLALLMLMYWLVSQAFEGGERQSSEVVLSVDALAQEELAMESEQELAQVARTTQLIVAKNVQEFREVAFSPAEVVSNPVAVVQKTSDQSLVSNFTPSKASESAQTEAVSQPKTDAPVLTELSPTELPALEVEQLEVAAATGAKVVEPVDPTKDDFKLNEEAIQQIKTRQEQLEQVTAQKVNVRSDSTSVATSQQPVPTTDAVSAVDGLEADDAPRKLEGTTTQQALAENLPGQNPVDALTGGLELEVGAVDPTKGDFKGNDGDLQQVKSGKAESGQAKNDQVNVQSGSGSVAASGKPAPTTDTGGDVINPVDGLEADGSQAKLEGVTSQAVLAANLPGEDPLDTFPDALKFEVPKNKLDGKALTRNIKDLSGKPSLEVIEALGGSGATERAIGLALNWFSNNQEPDGHWEMSKHGSNSQYNTAGAGTALLCYYGWGIKHGTYGQNSKYPQHVKAVDKAIDWLMKQQKEDGDLRGSTGGNHGMYAHGIASIAICEAYGLTKDSKLKESAAKAVDFILKAQHEQGGWRYQPRTPGDLSVVGWQYMALHSARMAGLEIPDEPFTRAGRFIDSVSGGKQGGLYGYTNPGPGPPAMTATGMFMRQLDLARPTEPRMQESAAFIKARMLKAGTRDLYYEYYATLAMYQHQGPIWRQWNDNLKEVYIALQETTGANIGSWDPKHDGKHAKAGGRVLTTGLAVLSLEVYYRLLPLYGFGRDEDNGGPAAGGAP